MFKKSFIFKNDENSLHHLTSRWLYPWDTIQDIDPQEWLREDIALIVNGDSMYPKYLDGDVIIQLQQDCESGQDCAL